MVLFYSSTKKQHIQQKPITAEITSLNAFGKGITHHNGKTVFVSNALPDERVDIVVTEHSKHCAKAKVVKYHTLSEARIEPKCIHYGQCGGCSMQHISQIQQKQVKAAALLHLIKKETREQLDIEQVGTILSQPYHYRRRARMSIKIQNNQFVIGFRQSESDKIVDIKQCPVLVAELEKLIIPLKQCLHSLKGQYALGHVELISVNSGIIVVLRHTKPLIDSDIIQLKQFGEDSQITLCLYGSELVYLTGRKEHFYDSQSLKLLLSPLDFIQINEDINHKMVQQAIKWLALNENDQVLDLFCGMGNFTLPIAQKCQYTVGVEGVDRLVEKAKQNAIINQPKLMNLPYFYQQDLDKITLQSNNWLKGINKVLLDPARAGAYQALELLVKAKLERVVYISCNPATLARDSALLIQSGYCIAAVSVLDMFPQTKHIESMLLFIKNGA